ncbi:hypothetical protein B0H17DRAFT_1134708 [Mycena rosella]|uniref:Uncharacterized protein n=1 Tax=Mycena rosella TaxID=1033263 RepID=A0AAD7DHZ3_MYCRO|nr:hypothetical protein B0H17DRAFT_1134708 [Mycena rosella]
MRAEFGLRCDGASPGSTPGGAPEMKAEAVRFAASQRRNSEVARGSRQTMEMLHRGAEPVARKVRLRAEILGEYDDHAPMVQSTARAAGIGGGRLPGGACIIRIAVFLGSSPLHDQLVQISRLQQAVLSRVGFLYIRPNFWDLCWCLRMREGLQNSRGLISQPLNYPRRCSVTVLNGTQNPARRDRPTRKPARSLLDRTRTHKAEPTE